MPLPVELVDDIIDQILASTGSFETTSSTLALVSHTFRARTNFHRFSKISFIHRIEPISSVHKFLSLLTSNIWTPHAGVVRHVRQFLLSLGTIEEITRVSGRDGTVLHREFGPHPALTDGSVAKILSLIFRGASPDSEYRIHTTLVLSSFPLFGSSILYGISETNSWDDLVEAQFEAALQGLLDTHVTKLEILGLSDLPPTLLAASRIRKLTLRKSRFKLPSMSDHPMLGPMVHLQELEVDGASEFIQGFAHLAPTLSFPAVRHLQYHIDTPHTFWTSAPQWKHLDALETLIITINAQPAQFDQIKHIRPYSGHLQNLKKLMIAVNGNDITRLNGLTTDFAMGTVFTALLPHLPLTNDLDVSFSNEDFEQNSQKGIATIFKRFNFTLTDQVIGRLLAAFDKLTFTSTPPTITLALNVYIRDACKAFNAQEFCEAGYLFLRQKFPSTANGPGRKVFKNKAFRISSKDARRQYDITVSLVYSH